MFVKLLATTLAGLVLWAVAAHSSESAGKPERYTVRPYDTLWSIATSHYAGDPRDAIYRIDEKNHLHGSVIVPGQTLLLP
jgi:nucleoid-associated protein YgaU